MTEQIQVGEGGSTHKGARWPFVIGLIAVAVVALGLGMTMRWWQHRAAEKQTVEATPKLNPVISELQDLRLGGYYPDEYNKKLEKALSDTDANPETRYLLYIEKGNGLAAKQDLKGAIEAYLQAEQLQKTRSVAELLAESYSALGDKAKAIEYYKLAIARLPADRPTSATDKEALELKIKELEGV